MRSLLILIFFTALVIFPGKTWSASRLPTPIEDFLVNFGILPEHGQPQVCPETSEHVKEMSPQQLIQEAEAATSPYNLCAPIKFYKELIRQHPESPLTHSAWRELVSTLWKAQDFIHLVNITNDYLVIHRGYDDSEYMHYMMLRAIYQHMRSLIQSAEIMQFQAYILGASLEQNDSAPYLKNLKFQVFLDRYPKSPFAKEIEIYQNEARQGYGRNILKNARLDRVKMDYPKALAQIQMILNWGPILEIFAESLYERIEIETEFAFRLTNKRLLSDFAVNRFLNREISSPIAPKERLSLAKETFDQAHKDLETMKENIPDSSWTQKAEKHLKGYVINFD